MLIINGVEYSDDSTMGDGYAVTDHSGDYTITANDMNAEHRFTGAATVTLPTITGLMVSTGAWVIIAKRTTGNIVINRAGTDVFVEAGTTTLTNSNAAEIYASIQLIVEEAGIWSIRDQFGTFIGS